MTNKQLLQETEIAECLAKNSAWSVQEGVFVREWKFHHFRAAFAFVSEAALLFEKHNHHGDVALGYNRVQIRLSSHDVGGLTARDTQMAEALEKISC